MAIKRENIAHFYEKYKENLKTEESVIEQFTKADTKENWVANLKKKYRSMRQLYIENEALLNLYIRPFTEGRMELNDELADEFLKQIREASAQGYQDNLSMLELAEVLEQYFLKYGNRDNYIWTINLLGGIYNSMPDRQDGEKAAWYFQKIRSFKDSYFEIENDDVRKRIIYSFYNYAIVKINFSIIDPLNPGEIIEAVDEALDFYNDERVRSLEGDSFDFDELITELNYDVFGNYVLSHERETVDPDMLKRANIVLGDCYKEALKKNPNPFEMLDEIYCNYRRCQFFLGEISCTEFLEGYKAFCDYTIAHDTMEHEDGFTESRLFQVAVNHLPSIIDILNHYEAEYHGDPGLRKSCVDEYLKMIRQIPRTGNSNFVNDVLSRSVCQFLEVLTANDVDSTTLMNVMVSRDEITLIHSQMVSQIAGRILTSIFENKPELLIGSFDCESLVEVLEKRDQIVDFMSQACKIFDVGKLQKANIVNKQSRSLTKRELQSIYEHPKSGAKMLERIPSLNRFHDIVLGHHKSWDGKMGYPSDFDNTVSKDRIFIELVHMADCMDAATDFIGRSYKGQKTLDKCLEEFMQGRGSVYAPEIVDLIEQDKKLQSDLRHLLTEGRIQTYYEIYGMVLDQDDAAEEEAWYENLNNELNTTVDEKEQLINMLHESNKESLEFVTAMVRKSLLTLYIDMRNGKCKVFSNSGAQLFEHMPDGLYETFLKKYLEPAVLPEDWEKQRYKLRLSELTHMFVKNDGNYECELRVKMEGMYRWVRVECMQINESNAIPRTMAMILTDIHEAHSRNDQVADALKDAYHSAVEANKAKSLFLSSMSHDIRTPMNGIIGMTHIALQHLNDPDRVEYCLRKIDESSKHLLELINEVLDMSKIESGNTSLQNEPTYLYDMAKMSADLCATQIEKKHHHFTLDLSGLTQDYVLADPVRLRQIFVNLLSNAIKYTPQEGNILFKAQTLPMGQQEEGCYRFIVKDNGIGMSESFLQQLYEPFAREDNSMTSVEQGTGLGLSITQSIIAMMGGTIEAKSRQGEGTCFTVTLRFTRLKEDKMQKQETAQSEDNISFEGFRVLLTEDNELNREIASELLSDIGLEIETAKNGKEAVEKMMMKPDHYYDLIFMDIQMPIMNGYEATRAIRSLDSEYAKNIPIIAMTANVFQDDIMKAIESGMNEHVTKPIDMKIVCHVLQKWLKKIVL